MSTLSRAALLAIAGGLLTLAAASQAKPEYARKEKKACAYCHVNPNGGGARNPRGVFYGMHNHTFEGYDEAKVMGAAAETPKKGGPPAFKSAWKVEVPAATKRIGVGDVVGDKVPRLLVLDDHNKLTVLNVATATPKEEASADLGDQGAKFVVGAFAKGKPAVVVVPGAIFYREGDSVKKKAVADLADITGTVKFTDGTENLFFFGGGQPDVYGVDLGADKPLVAGREMVEPSSGGGVYSSVVAHLPSEMLGGLGVPEQGQKAGLLGMFDPRNEGKLYAWIPWADKDEYTLQVTGMDALGHDGGNGAFKPIWTSPKLAGKVLDATVGADPRNPKQIGIFVLMATGDGGKGRTVEFFALD